MKRDPETAFASRIIRWQRRHGRRGLPWQDSSDPYRVWLSEVMLQQTQVATVLGYYERFLKRFPDLQTLASAPLDDVLALWSGLGYYSRARNLHRCAQAVVASHDGRFPATSAELEQLPGIGRSTAAAIAAFCFGQRVAILDGNVKRVLTRVLGFGGDLTEPAQERELWAQATRLLPQTGIASYTQGLMDLGAAVCLARAPQCSRCPVQDGCVAAQTLTHDRYPVKSRKLKRGAREHVWLWLRWRGQTWLVQRPHRGIWAGLWSLPEFDSPQDLREMSARWPGEGESLPGFTHTLTHLDWTLHPVRWTLPARLGEPRAAALVGAWPTGRWFSQEQALACGLPAPLRKLLES